MANAIEMPNSMEKCNQANKVYQKYILFSYTKVQDVLKTDQRAYVSGHVFFSAHEIEFNQQNKKRILEKKLNGTWGKTKLIS